MQMDDSEAGNVAGHVEASAVVVVGAGAVGLMLACELGRLGVHAIVVERMAEPDAMPKGNGLVGHIATLVARRGLLRGIAGARALPVPRFGFGPLRLRLNPLRPNPLRILPIPQRRLEEALERRATELGTDVRRGHELVRFHDDGKRVVLGIDTVGGSYSLDAGFLVGCDGAHSFVRHQLGVAFPGTTGSGLARIGRVTIPAGAWRRLRDDVIELPGGRTVVLFQPNRTETGSISLAPVSALDRDAPADLYVVSTYEDRGAQEPAGQIPLAELTASIRRVLGQELPITHGEWMRSTVANARQAERYRVGRVLLAGDAAHLFPAGGSSLNVGMLDAVDLAKRLAAVISGAAPSDALEQYHRQRHAAGERALTQTRAQAALSAPGPDADALREVLAAALRSRNPRRYLARLLIGDRVD
jgi:2-polyprenyl-6-methoxyphenol hydroxylase and related FAD-dependent oxidoreductases